MNDIVKIIRYSWTLKKYYLITAALVVTISILSQVSPFIIRALINDLVKRGTGVSVATSQMVVLLIVLMATWCAVTLITNIQGYFGDILAVKLNSLLSERYYRHVLDLPLEYYDNEVAGRITSRLDRSIGTISQLMQAFANNFVGFFLTGALTLVILAYYSWPVALLILFLFPVYFWLTALSSSHWQAKQEGINHDTDQANGRFVESIGQIRVVKSFVQELTEFNFFSTRRKRILAQTRAQSVEWHKFDILRRLSLNLIFFGIYSIIIWQAIQGRFGPLQQAIGTVVLLINFAEQAQFPLFGSSFIVDNLQRAIAGSKDYFEVMNIVPAIQDAPSALPISISHGLIEFDNVTFSYDDGNTVLEGISFTIQPGTKLALVGESGEGKSTISNLLLRFYTVESGTIRIDGTDITSVTQSSIRSQVGVVFQEPALFSGTIAENISYGRPKATGQEIEQAAVAANADGFIRKLKNGYKSEIGERGVKLSGGQKQRIAIARAIIKNPPILILDEATSSLDSKAEHEVQQALNVLMQGRTTLIIAHRLSTIATVDQIVGLRYGKIVEQGTPTQLAEGSGIYAELLALQAPTEVNRAKLKKYDLA